MTAIMDRLSDPKTLLLDGATGTELGRRGVDLSSPAWTAWAILEQPGTLLEVHRDYVAAGAEILTANTFRTHARNLAASGDADRAAELTRKAVEIARTAAGGNAYIAGSVAPLEDCYSPHLTPAEAELEAEHRQMVLNLTDAGVDLILIETQVTIREAAIAARLAAASGTPFCVSFTCDRSGRILSGESLEEAFRTVAGFRPAAFLVNCLPVEEVLGALEQVEALARGIRLGAYANTGRLLSDGSWESTAGVKPAVYAEFAGEWIEAGISWIGGCCGTTPDHISHLRRII